MQFRLIWILNQPSISKGRGQFVQCHITYITAMLLTHSLNGAHLSSQRVLAPEGRQSNVAVRLEQIGAEVVETDPGLQSNV